MIPPGERTQQVDLNVDSLSDAMAGADMMRELKVEERYD